MRIRIKINTHLEFNANVVVYNELRTTITQNLKN